MMTVLAFGEIMLRLAPENHLRLRQAIPGRLEASLAGGEANVCASLAMLGRPARFITALPDNPLSDCVHAELRRLGIDDRYIRQSPVGRLGIFFLETGANQRSSTVLYDRQASSIALTNPADYPFEPALEGVDWVHVTGITPALSEQAFQSTLALVRLAGSRGIRVSCDLNFRKKLWRWKSGTAPQPLANACMKEILAHVDVVIANEEDAQDVLGIAAEGTSIEAGRINAEAYVGVAQKIAGQFPRVQYVAITLRESVSADFNRWGGMLYSAKDNQSWFAPVDEQNRYAPYAINDIVDRVGGGDSFAAGLIYALTSDDLQEPRLAVRFAAAASCLKHSIRGDFNYVTREEVLALMGGSASGRVRR